MTDDVLVTADWVESNLDAFQDDDSDLRLVEINNPTVTDESEYIRPTKRATSRAR